MRSRRIGRSTRLAVAVCTVVAFACSCTARTADATASEKPSSETVFGPSQPLGNGTVKTFVTLDDAGQPTEVGLRLTATALDGLPQDTGPAEMVMLAFPDQAARTAFNHVMLNWNPQGHEPPELFGKPHFDFHFDMVDMATIQAIIASDPDYAAKAERASDSARTSECSPSGRGPRSVGSVSAPFAFVAGKLRIVQAKSSG